MVKQTKVIILARTISKPLTKHRANFHKTFAVQQISLQVLMKLLVRSTSLYKNLACLRKHYVLYKQANAKATNYVWSITCGLQSEGLHLSLLRLHTAKIPTIIMPAKKTALQPGRTISSEQIKNVL